MTVDYSAMLRDDLMNGYVVLLKNNDSEYYVVIRPQADSCSNITAKRTLASFLFDIQH